MKTSYLVVLLPLFIACKESKKEVEMALPIQGTWKLVSGITVQGNDTSFTDYTSNQKTIKMINESHFSFLRHDLSQGKDSVKIFVSGGGEYSLKGTTYTENLEYCNYRGWEGLSFTFEMSFKGDTLIQQGVEKVEELNVDRIITEKYIREK